MKRLLLLLLLLLAKPAVASVYANLVTREVSGLRDGKDTVRIYDGNMVLKTTNPNARFPPGTKGLGLGEEIKAPMNDAGYRYYSELFKKLRPSRDELTGKIDYRDPKLDIEYAFQCENRFVGKEFFECVDFYASKYCSEFGMTKDQGSVRTKDYPVDGQR